MYGLLHRARMREPRRDDMGKLLCILQRRSDVTVEQMRAHWGGEQHLAVVRRLPGLQRFVQNNVTASPAGHVCDGVGELEFDDEASIEQVLASPEMAAAVESAKAFLDMERTGMVIAEEKTVIG
jgi:uncharacterized protein (TIGR02118 family)